MFSARVTFILLKHTFTDLTAKRKTLFLFLYSQYFDTSCVCVGGGVSHSQQLSKSLHANWVCSNLLMTLTA